MRRKGRKRKTMKNFARTLVLVLGTSVGAFAGAPAKFTSQVQLRSSHLTDKMTRDLKLNNYQAAKMRSINAEVVAKTIEAEEKYASDPATLDKVCKGICKQRDRELESVLSTDQYSRYFSTRNTYNAYDREFSGSRQMASAQTNNNASGVTH